MRSWLGFLAARAPALALLLTLACSETERPVYGADPFARDLPPVGPLAGKIVTSNAGDDTLSVVDPTTPGPAGRLTVGFNPVEVEGPHHLAADPSGRYLYVNLSLAVMGAVASGPHGVHGAGDQPGYVLKLDAVTGRELDRVQVDPNPGDAVLSPDGRTLYVTHYDEIRWRSGRGAANLAIIDTESMFVRQRRPLCPAAHGVRLAAGARTLYSTCGPDQIAVLDLADDAAPARLVSVPSAGSPAAPTCARCPYALAVAPDETVWVSNLGPNGGGIGRGSVEVYDPTLAAGAGGFDPTRRLVLRGRPVFASFVPDPAVTGGYRVLVPEQVGPGDSLLVYSAGMPGLAPERLATIALDPEKCLNAHMLLASADGARGQLICEGDHKGPGSLLWLDLAAGTLLAAVPTGVFPDGLVLVPPLAPAN